MESENAKPKRRGRQPQEGLTQTQYATLKTIRDFIQKKGFPPTVKELADILGIAAPSAFDQLAQLERKGYLKREPRKARSMEIKAEISQNPVRELVRVPILGVVAAGNPIFAQENIIGELLIDGHVVGRSPCFALEVEGDSMTGADIRNGDYVIVRRQPVAENNEIVVALLGDEATVKRLSIAGERIELRPENSRFKPISVGPEDELRILGKVIAIHRISKIQ